MRRCTPTTRRRLTGGVVLQDAQTALAVMEAAPRAEAECTTAALAHTEALRGVENCERSLETNPRNQVLRQEYRAAMRRLSTSYTRLCEARQRKHLTQADARSA